MIKLHVVLTNDKADDICDLQSRSEGQPMQADERAGDWRDRFVVDIAQMIPVKKNMTSEG